MGRYNVQLIGRTFFFFPSYITLQRGISRWQLIIIINDTGKIVIYFKSIPEFPRRNCGNHIERVNVASKRTEIRM